MLAPKRSMRVTAIVFAVLGVAFLVIALWDPAYDWVREHTTSVAEYDPYMPGEQADGGRWVWWVLGASFVPAAALFWWLGGLFTGLPKPPTLRQSIRSANETMAEAQVAMASATAMLGQMAGTSAEGRRLREQGQDGRVTVSAVRDTKATVNFDPILELDLFVFVGDRPPHVVQRREVVSRLVAPRLVPGASFAARVDPAEPDVFAPDWSRPLP